MINLGRTANSGSCTAALSALCLLPGAQGLRYSPHPVSCGQALSTCPETHHSCDHPHPASCIPHTGRRTTTRNWPLSPARPERFHRPPPRKRVGWTPALRTCLHLPAKQGRDTEFTFPEVPNPIAAEMLGVISGKQRNKADNSTWKWPNSEWGQSQGSLRQAAGTRGQSLGSLRQAAGTQLPSRTSGKTTDVPLRRGHLRFHISV